MTTTSYNVNIFKNKFKNSEKHPDYTGKVELEDGQVLNAAGWERKDKNGQPFISLKVSIEGNNSSKSNGGNFDDNPF